MPSCAEPPSIYVAGDAGVGVILPGDDETPVVGHRHAGPVLVAGRGLIDQDAGTLGHARGIEPLGENAQPVTVLSRLISPGNDEIAVSVDAHRRLVLAAGAIGRHSRRTNHPRAVGRVDAIANARITDDRRCSAPDHATTNRPAELPATTGSQTVLTNAVGDKKLVAKRIAIESVAPTIDLPGTVD